MGKRGQAFRPTRKGSYQVTAAYKSECDFTKYIRCLKWPVLLQNEFANK